MPRVYALRFGSCLFAALVVLTGAGLSAVRPARATVVQAVGFDAQCASAESIFVGGVRAVESRRNATRPNYFETLVTFGVEEVVAGSVPPVIELRFAGGRIGDQAQSIDGMPEFAVGERYVVFTASGGGPPLVSPIVGFNQGLYRVVQEESGEGVKALVRDRTGQPLSGPTAPYGAAVAAGADNSDETDARTGSAVAEPEIDAFIAAIREARGR